jgi:AcrR family transcriptional regulator
MSDRGYDNSRRSAAAAATAQRILAAAETLVALSGSLEVSLADVARAAGVSQPTLFRHFASRQRLFSAMAERAREYVAAGWRPARPGQLGDSVLSVYRRAARREPLMRWLVASPPAPPVVPRTGDREAVRLERILLLLTSPQAWLFWHDQLGLTEEEAAGTAAWAIERLWRLQP